MCGRYNFSAEESAEIQQIIREVSEMFSAPVRTGEVYPTNLAAVLVADGGAPSPRPMIWGFPHFQKSGVIINARSETALEKRMFRDSLLTRRCVVPSSGFFEWKKEDGSKTKLLFRQPGESALYMAGFYNRFKTGDSYEERFVILTTAANDSMRDEAPLSLVPSDAPQLIHDRMPVILRREEREAWLQDGVDFAEIFRREDILLEHSVA